MDQFRLAEVTPSFAPVLWDEEHEIILCMEKHIRLYDGDVRTDYDDGDAILTTHRLLWLEKGGQRRAIFLHLSQVVSVKSRAGFYPGVFTSPKLTVYLKPSSSADIVSPPVGSPGTDSSSPNGSSSTISEIASEGPTIKLSFRSRESRDGGRDAFQDQFRKTLAARKWLTSKSSTSAARKRPDRGFQTRSAGIGGITQMMHARNEQVNTALSSAFTDLDALIASAEELVKLSERMAAAAKNDSERSQIDDVFASAGIANPVTKEVAGTRFHKELAKQLCDFVQEPLIRSWGMMSLVDVYCGYNRVRRTDMISPEDLEAAIELFPKLGLPLAVRTFAGSGTRVLLSTSFDAAAVSKKLQVLAESRAPISEVDVAREMHMAMPVAKHYLHLAEEQGSLCRDESRQGILYYPNRFAC